MPRGGSITHAFRQFGCPRDSIPTATLNERKSDEIRSPLSKSIAPSPELQTKSCHSNPTGAEVEPGVPSRARRSANQIV